VEDEPDQAAILEAVLRHEGLDVVVAVSGEQALDIHQRTPADVLVTDLNLPGMTGVELIKRLAPPAMSDGPEPKQAPPAVVVVTGGGSVNSAVEALKLGAADYLTKPLDPARLVSLVRELLASDNVRESDGDDDDDPASSSMVFEGMVGGSRRMREVFTRIDRVAGTMAPVLIVGESGTGKELVARAIHSRSRRYAGPFVPVHTGAIPRELIGSELFGHEKGSFTGAFAAAEGKFEAAAGGTVFLDEVGTMDTAVQVSLLRVLETYRFTRVGGRKEIEADVRIVAATNKDLLDLVDDGVFREDLYYRLNVFTVTLPPLRERGDDILPIAERFLIKYARRYGTPARRLDGGAVDRLMAHDWPGNVRELRNVIEQTALFAPNEVVAADDIQLGQGRIERRPKGRLAEAPPPAQPPPMHAPAAPAPIDEAMLPADFAPLPSLRSPLGAPSRPPPLAAPTIDHGPPTPVSALPVSANPAVAPPRPAGDPVEQEVAREGADREHPLVLRLPVGTRLADAERKLILLTLEAVRGNKQRAARVLGISRRGLYSKLQAYGEHVGAHEAPEAPVDSTDEPMSTSEPATSVDAEGPMSISDVETPPLSEESPHASIHEDDPPQAECPG
jgi:DNA-binding NtrC family response regulator